MMKFSELFILALLLGLASLSYANDGLGARAIKASAESVCIDDRTFEKSAPNYLPEDGFVPNEQVASEVAIAILAPIYGREKVLSQRPLHAKLENGIWRVRGTLKQGLQGGVAEIDLCKQNGGALRVIHGK